MSEVVKKTEDQYGEYGLGSKSRIRKRGRL